MINDRIIDTIDKLEEANCIAHQLEALMYTVCSESNVEKEFNFLLCVIARDHVIPNLEKSLDDILTDLVCTAPRNEENQ